MALIAYPLTWHDEERLQAAFDVPHIKGRSINQIAKKIDSNLVRREDLDGVVMDSGFPSYPDVYGEQNGLGLYAVCRRA